MPRVRASPMSQNSRGLEACEVYNRLLSTSRCPPPIRPRTAPSRALRTAVKAASRVQCAPAAPARPRAKLQPDRDEQRRFRQGAQRQFHQSAQSRFRQSTKRQFRQRANSQFRMSPSHQLCKSRIRPSRRSCAAAANPTAAPASYDLLDDGEDVGPERLRKGGERVCERRLRQVLGEKKQPRARGSWYGRGSLWGGPISFVNFVNCMHLAGPRQSAERLEPAAVEFVGGHVDARVVFEPLPPHQRAKVPRIHPGEEGYVRAVDGGLVAAPHVQCGVARTEGRRRGRRRRFEVRVVPQQREQWQGDCVGQAPRPHEAAADAYQPCLLSRHRVAKGLAAPPRLPALAVRLALARDLSRAQLRVRECG
eukprot:4793038-Pleurochrysis_carterae.AAC.10